MTLERLFEEVTAGQGYMVAVTGEPGIGKTTLVEDVLNVLSRGPHRPSIARGRCSERLAGTDAFLPLFEALDSLLHSQSIGGFSETMRRLAPTWYLRVAPLAAESLSTEQMVEDVRSASPERMKRELATFLQEIRVFGLWCCSSRTCTGLICLRPMCSASSVIASIRPAS